MNIQNLESRLYDRGRPERLKALRELMGAYQSGKLPAPTPTSYVNNHIHTVYSFSPYTPAAAAYTAWKNGLCTAGIMDHDSIAGAQEFIEAGKLIGIAVTIGFECRCKMDSTPFAGRRINHTDQDSVAYLAAHGIPHQNIAKAQAWLAPYHEKRMVRGRAMTANINKLMAGTGVALGFDKDVLPISYAHEGGSVTERHILYALAEKITAQVGRGRHVLDLLAELDINVTGKNRELLLNTGDLMYEYYLLGELKASMAERFYIPADDECPDVHEFIAFMREIGGIAAYAYLGDVGDSVTGDKKTQKFEDAYLDELISWAAQAGFNAVTYMPARNTPEQLARLIALCERHDLFQISGEDINTPFQYFICKALDKPQFKHLIDSTWALIGHENAASADIENGMFSAKNRREMPDLNKRIAYFGRKA
ncbi:MAG: PHP domain-containing protein [Oscillospiraceae bacterium]|nr:PHP domain-containing protein [Oscillospiraceae bacterium]